MPQKINGPHFILVLPAEEAGQRLLLLAEGETSIGRSRKNDIVIEDPAVSLSLPGDSQGLQGGL